MVRDFTPLVKIYVFAITLRVVLGKEVSKPLKSWPFGDLSVALFHTYKVISDKDPTSLAIYTFIGQFAVCIF